MDDIIAKAKNYSFPQHLMQIQKQSEQRLQVTPQRAEVNQDHNAQEGQETGADGREADVQQDSQISKVPDLLDLYIDAKDTVNNWCVAKIIDHDLEHGKISMHFDGWSNRYDDTQRITSTRIAPFRKYSYGYTGAAKQASRDFQLNYAYQVTLQNRIEQITQSGFRCFSNPYECTQFIRGELYIHFDSLLTLLLRASPNDLERIFQFAKEVLKMCLKWIELFPSVVKHYKLSLQHPNLYLVDLDTAISCCWYEIFDMIHKCLGLCPRVQKFCQTFRQGLTYQSELVAEEQLQANGFQLSLVGMFADIGGFKALLDMIEIKSEENAFRCPIPIVNMVAKAFSKLREMNVKQEFIENTAKILSQRIEERLQQENFSDMELKETHTEELKRLIYLFSYYNCQAQSVNQYQVQELYELWLAKRYLMCPYFEMKIKGMKEFKLIEDKIVNTIVRSGQNDKKANLQFANYLNLFNYSQWILDHKIIEFIFSENQHQELIKRSHTILYLMIQNTETFPEQILHMLWNCCTPDKHEDIIRATYELLAELARSLPLPRVKFMYEKIQTIPMQSIDIKIVTFLKDYTLNTMKNLQQKKEQQKQMAAQSKRSSTAKPETKHGKPKGLPAGEQQQKEESVVSENNDQIFEMYDCQIFWDIFQEENKHSSFKTKELALQSLIEVLKQGSIFNPNIKDSFINQSLENLRQSKTVYLTIIFLQNLLASYPLETAIMSTRQQKRNTPSVDTIETVIAMILKSVDLYQVVIELAAKYMMTQKNCREVEQIDSGVKEDKIISHEEWIRLFINLIEFLVIHSRSISLQLSHVEAMFKIFVTEATTPIETREFFDFLTKENQNARSRERSYLLDEKLRLQVFTTIMCNEKAMNCINLTLQAYECFHSLFKGVNVQENTLTLDTESNINKINNFNEVQGLKTLWKIVVYCKTEEVLDLSRKLLCDCFLFAKSKNQKEKYTPQDLFITTCRSYLHNAIELKKKGVDIELNEEIILNTVRLMKTYLSRFDKEHLLPELRKVVDGLNQHDQKAGNRIVRIKLDPDEVYYEIEVNMNCAFWELMRQSSQVLHLKMSEFFIFTKQGPLQEDAYSLPLKNYDIKEVTLGRYSIEKMEKEFPSYVIGYCEETLAVLIEVLNSKNDIIVGETIILIESLQLSPKIKQFLLDRVARLQQLPLELTDDLESSPTHFKEWSNLLAWEKNGPLNFTMYRLTILRELTNSKQYVMPKHPSKAQESQIMQDRMARIEFQQSIVSKGGFHFLLHMFTAINKRVDFDKEQLISKTLQLLLGILDRLHQGKCMTLLQQYEKNSHITTMLEGSFVLIQSFMHATMEKQKVKQEELITKLTIQNNNECTPAVMNQVYNQLLVQVTDINMLSACLSYAHRLLQLYPKHFLTFAKSDLMLDMLKLGLIEIAQRKIQEKVQIFYQQICLKIEPQLSKDGLPTTIFPSYVLLNVAFKEFIGLSIQVDNTQKMKTFFKLLVETMNGTNVCAYLPEIVKPNELVQTLINIIQTRKIREVTSRDEDAVLAGLFDVTGAVLLNFQEVRRSLINKSEFIQFITHQGLFEKETRAIVHQSQNRLNIALPPMCKHVQTRKSCLELLRILCMDDIADKLFIAQYLKDTVCKETFWRTPRKSDWSFHVQQPERSLCGYAGLKNLGCICYMNSIFQQLYMIPSFRKALIEVEDRSDKPPEENILHQVKCIFGGLMEGEKQYYSPKGFCKAFKDIDGNPTDVYQQKDVDEFFDLFVDRIEGLIKGTNQEKVMNNLFRGVTANELICKDCPHYSEREEPFRAIPLQVKNKHTVLESLKYSVQGEELKGDNAYYCEKCEKKVTTLMRSCVKRMPNILFLVLKRFEYDFESWQKVKVNDYCEFPTELDMSPYSQQELARQDLIKMMEDKNLSKEDLNEEQLHILERVMPPNYFKYKLKGIVVHYGTADQGHYYSFIQDREDKNNQWFEFNDTIVNEFDPKDIPEEAFGGEDTSVVYNINEMQQQNEQVDQAMIQAMNQSKTKIRNAYVLIYDRVDMYDMQKVNDVIDDLKASKLSPKELQKLYASCKINQSTNNLPPQIAQNVQEVIMAKNRKFWLSKTIFSPNLIQQVFFIFQDFKFGEDKDYDKYLSNSNIIDNIPEFKAFKFVISFFMTISLRSKERGILPDFVQLIRNALQKNIGLCLWMLDTFISQDFMKEFLIDCPVHDMARFAAGLLKTAMQQVYEMEESNILKYINLMNTPDELVKYITSTQGSLIEEEQVVDARLQSEYYSNCSQTKVYKLMASNSKLPKLIMLINSFIHMSTSNYCLSKYRMTGQFWSVFSHFSSLGDVARLYLLRTQTLGRLIDVMLNIQPDNYFDKQTMEVYKNKFRDECLKMRVPLFIITKPNYLAIDPERSQVQMSTQEKKDIIKFISPPKTFLLLAISNLARSCALVNQGEFDSKSIFSLGSLNFLPLNEEIELMQTHSNIKWWSKEHSKLAKNAVAVMFAHVAHNSREFSQEYIQTLVQAISKEHTMFIRIYERPLLRLIQVADKFQQERVKRLLVKLVDLFKNNTQFFIVIECLTEMVIKLSLRCPIFATALAKNQTELFKLIDRYYQQYPTMPVGKGKMLIFREGSGLRWNDIKFLNHQKLDWIANYVKNRTKILYFHLKKTYDEQSQISQIASQHDSLIESLTPDTDFSLPESNPYVQNPQPEDLLDSDNDLYFKCFKPGEKVDFCHNGNWYTGKVEISLDEMIKVVCDPPQQSSNQPAHLWIELESANLAPLGSMTKNNREQLMRFFQDLSTYVV